MKAPTPRRLQRKQSPPPLPPRLKPRTVRLRIPADVEAQLQARAGGRCEMCGQAMAKGRCQRHHRRLRSQGGLDELVNLVLIHPGCHHTVHMNPEWARQNGWIVPSTRRPASVPITLHGHRRVRLATDGTYIEHAA